jgi:beta-barrel assembly-enhancing protease
MKSRIYLISFAAVVAATTACAQFNMGEFAKNLKLPGGTDASKATKNVTNVGKVVKSQVGIGPQEELAIGESAALEIVTKFGGIVRNEDMTKRVNLIGRALAFYSIRPALNWKFAVLDSPSINAFSAPGGIVFITRGLYDLVGNSDDALAAVLSHEIAHITGRHALKIIETAQGTEAGKSLVVDNVNGAAQLEAAANRLNLSVDLAIKTILEQGYDAPKEYEADKEGRALAVTLGYAPGGLRQVLIKLQQRTGSSVAVFSTHPPLASRIQRLPAE